MRFHINTPDDYPRNLELPWAEPLETWPAELFVDVARGIHRNVVRFTCHEGKIYAIKELPEPIARREYGLLRRLHDENLPVVEPVGLVLERGTPGQRNDARRDHAKALLITRFLDLSLPYRFMISSGATAEQIHQMLDALSELLVRLHIAGFFWGDVSLSNALFRRDAGKLAAYVVDAETGEMHSKLSDGQRSYDLQVAEENLAGELMDLQAGYGLPEGEDPVELAQSVVESYNNLWTELTRAEVFSAQEQYRIDARIARLNELGFDVEELEIEQIEGGHALRMRAKVVELGHHRRRLQSLTGLLVQENQARRLLNDIKRFGAWIAGKECRVLPESAIAHRWYRESYQAALAAIPARQRATLDDAEAFHEILEHRWYLSEKAGHDVGMREAVKSYVDNVLESPPPPGAERQVKGSRRRAPRRP